MLRRVLTLKQKNFDIACHNTDNELQSIWIKAFNGNKANITIDAYYRQPKQTQITYLVLTWQITWSIYIIILKAVLEEKGFF